MGEASGSEKPKSLETFPRPVENFYQNLTKVSFLGYLSSHSVAGIQN